MSARAADPATTARLPEGDGDWNIARLADAEPQSWRNGGGFTRELAVWPAKGDWHWRMSVAEVAADGPFSRFEGVARWFAVLGGAGVRLAVGADVHTLTRESAPFSFDGGAAVDCALIGGATQDFNLMVRGGGARMERLSQAQVVRARAGRTVALYSGADAARVELDGSVCVLGPQTLAWRTLHADAALYVTGRDALWMEVDP